MKIALLSHEGGGISSVCDGLAYSLSKEKIQATVFSAGNVKKPTTEEINDYLEVVRLPWTDWPPRSIWFHFLNSSRLLRLLENFNVVHGISPNMAFSYTWLREHRKKPLVTTLHGSYRAALKAFASSPLGNWTLSDLALHVLELPLQEMTVRRCFAKSRKIVACSFTTLNELATYEKADVSKASVIYNGVNLGKIPQGKPESRDESKDSEHEYTIMYAGRLFWMKGVTFALEAYENLKRQFKDLHLRIFGKGPLENYIRGYLASHNSNGGVYFGGFLPHQELIREIKKSDVIVFPSLYESQPMFVLETMACKKPLVAFDLPYSREIIINEHNGLLSRVGDVKDYSNKIALALQDKKLRHKLGENAYDYVEKNHNWDKQVTKYIKVYREASAPRS